MKKYLKLLSLTLITTLMLTTTAYGMAKNELSTIGALANGNSAKISKNKVVNNKSDISKIAELEGFENSDDIVQIIYTYNNVSVTPLDEMEVSPMEWGAQEIYFKNQRTYEARGGLIRSSYYSAPGGAMTVSESVAISFSTTVGLSAKVVSTEIGFSVTATIGVSDTQNISVPTGYTYNCKAYVNNLKYSFEIWEDDVFFDDYLGTGTVTKPIGVIFVVYK